MNNLKDIDLHNVRVFYRPDYNVPMQDGVIMDDFRILATQPTLDYFIKQGAKIIIGTHLGRPDGERVAEFELRPIAERLADLYPQNTVRLAHECMAPQVHDAVAEMQPGDILLLPNLRFYKEEEANNEAFAESLAHLADIYVNDAFAVDHRAHASLVGIPKILPAYPGFLLQKELDQLGSLLKAPKKPFVVVMGGAKVSDKIEVIRSLAKMADHLLIGGAMANTFLLAKGEPVGASKVEEDKKELATSLLEELGDKLVLAADYVKDKEGEDFRYVDIGPKAVEEFKTYLQTAKTIFWNGSLGYVEDPAFAKATEEIANFIGGLKGVTSIVAGGDTVETITNLNLHNNFTFISTGGGAALELLAGEVLPAVQVLEESLPPEIQEEEPEEIPPAPVIEEVTAEESIPEEPPVVASEEKEEVAEEVVEEVVEEVTKPEVEEEVVTEAVTVVKKTPKAKSKTKRPL